MKRFHKILTCIMMIIASAVGHEVYAQLPSSGTWGKLGGVVDASGELELTGDIDMIGVIRIPEGKTFRITSRKNVTIRNTGIAEVGEVIGNTTVAAGRSRMFTVKSGGSLIIEGVDGARITIDGGADYKWENYTLTPQDNSRTLSEAIANEGTLTLSNVTITDVRGSNQNGGAILINGATLDKINGPTTLTNCTIKECYSQLGSAIMIDKQRIEGEDEHNDPENCKVTLNNTIIQHCISGGGSARNSGGAIRTYGNSVSNLEMIGVIMKENYAMRSTNNDPDAKDANGGALFWNAHGNEVASICKINGCQFINNRSDDNGGAIKSQGSLVFTGSPTTIKGNSAPHGGGLYIEGYHGGANSTTGASHINITLNQNLILEENNAPSDEINNGTGGGVEFYFGSMNLIEGSTITVNLRGAQIIKNSAEAKGGGIFFENNNTQGFTIKINLNHGIVENNNAELGGGVYVSNGSVEYDSTIQVDSTLSISTNWAQQNGAGIYIKNGSMKMAHGTINQNEITGSGNGGGIYIENGDFTIKDGEISGNTVNNGNGGGVYILGQEKEDKIIGNFTMDGSGSIKDNSASGNGKNVGFGGGIYVNGGNFTMTENATDGEISNNSSTQDGGGVYINGGQFIQKKGDISSNTSGGNGGGVCIVNGGTFTMSGGRITANGKEGQTIHTQNGGGVYLNGGNFTLQDGTISNNGASVNGGGVFLTGQNCTYQLQKGYITGNSAGNGGGVYLENGLFKLGTSGNILDGNISNNAAQFGGGVYIGSGSTSNVSDDTSAEPTEGFIMYGGNITGNSTTDAGGGIYLNGGSFLMYNGDIISNSSRTDGGGVCIANNGNFTMNNGNITQNGKNGNTSVTVNGGGVFLDGGTLTVNAGNISENAATASGGGVYISNGNVGMQTGKILSNSCGEYGGGIYVYNPSSTDIKTVSVTGGSLLDNTAKYGGGICVDGLIGLTIGNVEIAENTATNGGGVCLMNNANMTFGAGQIKSNRAVKSEGSQIYADVTGFEKDIKEVEGLGGGIYLNSNTTLIFDKATELGLFGNTADNGADEIFANGKGTSVILPDVTGMKLDGYPGAGNLKWIEDYITNDTGYGNGTKLKGGSWNQTNVRYRDAISNNDQDNIFNLDKGTTEDDRTKYICFALGYEIIYVTITRHGLEQGESAVYTLSKSGTDESEDFSVIITGDGSESVSKKVAVTAGVWTVKEELWNWTYDFTPVNDLLSYVPDEDSKEEIEDGDIVVDASNRLIQKNIAKSFNRDFIFKGNKRQGLPMNAEAIVVNVMGN